MKYTDVIFGQVSIEEPVILELLQSPVLTRLKGISQAGYMKPYFPNNNRTRWEHSLGVFLVLRYYGAGLIEQVAGLIHDVSHTAFSHAIDYVFDEGSPENQSFQDDTFETFVRESEIPAILARHGLDLEAVIDDANLPLKEKPLPDLCADRIEYNLGDGVGYGTIPEAAAAGFITDLRAIAGQWVFANATSAEAFARLFARNNRECFAGLPSAKMFITLRNYLKHALKQKYIERADFYGVDSQVLEKIAAHHTHDAELKHLFDYLEARLPIQNNPANFDERVVCKSRFIDPLCLVNNEIQHLSTVLPGWKQIMTEDSQPKEYFLKFG